MVVVSTMFGPFLSLLVFAYELNTMLSTVIMRFAFLAKALGFKRIVYTNHEGEYFKGGFVEWSKLRAVSLSDVVIFVSPKMLNELKSICKSEPHLMPCAVDRVAFNKNFDSADCRRRIGAPRILACYFFPGNPQELEKKTLISL